MYICIRSTHIRPLCAHSPALRTSARSTHIRSLYAHPPALFSDCLITRRSPVINAIYIVVRSGVIYGSERQVSHVHLDCMFQFIAVKRNISVSDLSPGDLVITSQLGTVLFAYNHWRAANLRALASFHDMPAGKPRSTAISEMAQEPDTSYLSVASAELKRSIIAEWERTMLTASVKDLICAVCARRTPVKQIRLVNCAEVDLGLLCNPHLPDRLQPETYNRAAYEGAILHPQGLTTLDQRGDMRVCNDCGAALKKNMLPRYALANWLYYAREKLPQRTENAFASATHLELMLVARARASVISYKFRQSSDNQATPGTHGHPTSQRYVKGNVAIHPQDATHLSNVLPPSNDVIRDSVCALFVGKRKPTKETIASLRPIVVRKSVVKDMIDFLTTHNPHYRVSREFHGYSQENMDNLLGERTAGLHEGVPCSMEVGHIEVNDAVEGATSSYVPGHEQGPGPDEDDMLMETVGYTDHDDTPVSYNDMKMKALAHCLRGRPFVQSQAGSELLPDFENSQLLSWLFPHLDPWGIGGFFEPRRSVKLTLDQQLKYLLSVEDSAFRDDPNFAFVYYNIRQKRAVYESVSFRVAASERDRVSSQLLNIDTASLDRLAAAFKDNPQYRAQNEEQAKILRLLQKVNVISHDLPGSNGYKVMLRNQIRALINHEGTPTLFITLNPSDRDHPLVRLYAGHEINLEDAMRGEELSRWQRTVLAAREPAACARFFDKIITNFIDIVLRFGRSGKGLFG
ncbi:hypothetical protein FKP32DRAFT_1726256, partial [Trametes sanguinea]